MRTKKLNLQKEPFLLNQLRLLKPFESLMRKALAFQGIAPETKFFYLVVQYFEFFDVYFKDAKNKNDDNKALYDMYKLSASFVKSAKGWLKSKGVIFPSTFDPISIGALVSQFKGIFGGNQQNVPPPPKQDNTMLYVVIGVAALALILIVKK